VGTEDMPTGPRAHRQALQALVNGLRGWFREQSMSVRLGHRLASAALPRVLQVARLPRVAERPEPALARTSDAAVRSLRVAGAGKVHQHVLVCQNRHCSRGPRPLLPGCSMVPVTGLPH